jgi:hypothetical protein
MNTSLLETIIASLIGTIITINGIALNADDILNQAKASANGANLHQLATVVELYYSEHDTYPTVSGGEALVNTLESEGYIRNRPLDPNVFKYEPKNNGQDYVLKLTE